MLGQIGRASRYQWSHIPLLAYMPMIAERFESRWASPYIQKVKQAQLEEIINSIHPPTRTSTSTRTSARREWSLKADKQGGCDLMVFPFETGTMVDSVSDTSTKIAQELSLIQTQSEIYSDRAEILATKARPESTKRTHQRLHRVDPPDPCIGTQLEQGGRLLTKKDKTLAQRNKEFMSELTKLYESESLLITKP